MIVRLNQPAAARAWCAERRSAGASLGFVPTMGALHEGHLALVRRALLENDAACVSVFVNPLQFNEAADLESYPRDFDGDARLLDELGCDMVFTGTLAEFFPELPGSTSASVPRRDPGPWSRGLEGDGRPGHFEGVATIVARLFEVVRPRRAYFGEKDFQQAMIVRDLARELGFPDVVVCATEREPSGLARASRNLRLDAADRVRAECIARSLFRAREGWRAGVREADELRALLLSELEGAGGRVEYAEVRDPEAWTAERPTGPLAHARAFVVVWFGDVRLIDNLELG